MVLFLVFDVGDNIIHLRIRITESAKTLLPHKLSRYPSFSVNESCGTSFDISYQIGDSDIGSHAHKNTDMVRHRVNLHYLLFFVVNDAGDVLVEFCLVLFGDERLSSFYGKHDVYVDFGVGVRHRRALTHSINMPLFQSGEGVPQRVYQHTRSLSPSLSAQLIGRSIFSGAGGLVSVFSLNSRSLVMAS